MYKLVDVVHIQNDNFSRVKLHKLQNALQLFKQLPCFKAVYQVLYICITIQKYTEVDVPDTKT